MKVKHFVTALAMALVLAACGADSYESLTEEIDKLMAEQIPMTDEQKAQIATLREQADQLHGVGKADESVEALKEAHEIIKKAEDAALLGKSEG